MNKCFLVAFTAAALLLAFSVSAYATNATDTRTVVCKDNSGNIVADSNCTGAKPETTRVGAACTPNDPVYQTASFNKDYDGWVKTNSSGNEILMCDRINIYNWACDGHKDCSIVGAVNYVRNSGALCNVTGTIRFTAIDGTCHRPISNDVYELMYGCGESAPPSMCGPNANTCINGGVFGNGRSVNNGPDGTQYNWTCTKDGASEDCEKTQCPPRGCI